MISYGLHVQVILHQKGQILRKTTDTHLLDWIHAQMEEHPRLIPLHMKYRALTGQPFEVIVEDENGHAAKAQSDSIIEKQKMLLLHKIKSCVLFLKQENIHTKL